MQQFYDTDVNKEYAIRGNSAVLKCQVPSFVADFVSVVSWHTEQGDDFYPSTSDYGNSSVRHEPLDVTCVCITVVQQFYQTEVNNEYVIRGNSAVLKCSIPSFVADFVSVVSWQDDSGNMYAGTDASSNQGNVIPTLFAFSLSRVFQLFLSCMGLVRGNWQGESYTRSRTEWRDGKTLLSYFCADFGGHDCKIHGTYLVMNSYHTKG